jgi:hypothetical protein
VSFSHQSRVLRSARLTALVAIGSVLGAGLSFAAPAHGLISTVGYPLGLCQANLVEASTGSNEGTTGTVALSLGGSSATADECFNDAYTNSGAALTTGSSASSSVAAIAIEGCYTAADYQSLAGGGLTSCNRGFFANVSVFDDATEAYPGGVGLVSFSLIGDASGSWLAVAPFGNAYSPTGIAVGCKSAYSDADVWWKWCTAWEGFLTPEQRQLVYTTLDALAAAGLAETQAVVNFYNGVMANNDGEIENAFAKPTEPCDAEHDGDTLPGPMHGSIWECRLGPDGFDWHLIFIP